MIEPLRRIEPPHEIGYALNGVRLAQVALANREDAKKNGPLLGAFAGGTALWCAVLLLTAWAIPESYALAAAQLTRAGGAVFLLGGAIFLLGTLFPSLFADTPALGKKKTDDWSVIANSVLYLFVVAFFPVIAGFAFANILGTMRCDHKVKVTGNQIEDEPTASAVLADDRVRKLYGDLVGQIDDWNEAINQVNRLIHLANAGEAELSDEETALIADYHAQQAELDRLVTLATALLSEGPVGTRPGNPETDAEDPLLRLRDRGPRLRERMATLSEGSKRLVAAREVHAATTRT